MKNEIDLESDVLTAAEYLHDTIQLASDMVGDLHLVHNIINRSPYQLKTAKQLEAVLFSITITSNDLKSELSTFINSKYHSNRNNDLKAEIK